MTKLTRDQAVGVITMALLALPHATLRRVPEINGEFQGREAYWLLEHGEHGENTFTGSTLRDLADIITGYEA